MATKRGRRKTDDKSTDSLLAALRFVALAQSDIGTIMQRHCIMRDGWIAATDNIVTVAHKIADDLSACPQTKRLIAALERCGEGVAIVHDQPERLRITSGPLRVTVPCVELQAIPLTWGDPLAGPLDERFLAALASVGHIASETGTNVHYVSVLVRGQTMSATTGAVLAEAFHANNTPPYWVLPATTVKMLLKVSKKLVGLGFSGRSATFHYEDGSWLKTQLFEDRWPNVDKVFDNFDPSLMIAIPETFFDTLNTLEALSDGGKFEIQDGKVINKDNNGECEVPGLVAGPIMRHKDALYLAKIAKRMYYAGNKRLMYFVGDDVRAAVSTFTE